MTCPEQQLRQPSDVETMCPPTDREGVAEGHSPSLSGKCRAWGL